MPSGFSITLDDKAIVPSSTVLLLGVTIDQHFTMAAHIDQVVRKCHGLLGMLRRAASYLPPALLTLAYTSLIRSYLEYNSATFATAAPTHLRKLDVIQKIASRVITNSPSQTHSAPLQILLGLDALELRRTNHVVNLVEKIVSGRTHPYFIDYLVLPLTLTLQRLQLASTEIWTIKDSAGLVCVCSTTRQRTVARSLVPSSWC